MKKKIYTRMTIISVIFTIITMIASVGIFYNIYRSQVMEILRLMFIFEKQRRQFLNI